MSAHCAASRKNCEVLFKVYYWSPKWELWQGKRSNNAFCESIWIRFHVFHIFFYEIRFRFSDLTGDNPLENGFSDSHQNSSRANKSCTLWCFSQCIFFKFLPNAMINKQNNDINNSKKNLTSVYVNLWFQHISLSDSHDKYCFHLGFLLRKIFEFSKCRGTCPCGLHTWHRYV